MDTTVATVREGDNTTCVASWDTLGSYCWINFVGKVCSYRWACMNLSLPNDVIILAYIQRELLTSLRPEVHRISKTVKSHLRILRARMVKWSRLHTENPESLGATCGFVHAGPKWIYVQMNGNRILENHFASLGVGLRSVSGSWSHCNAACTMKEQI